MSSELEPIGEWTQLSRYGDALARRGSPLRAYRLTGEKQNQV